MRCFIVLQVLWVVTGDSKMTKTKPSLILKELTQGKDDAKGKTGKDHSAQRTNTSHSYADKTVIRLSDV